MSDQIRNVRADVANAIRTAIPQLSVWEYVPETVASAAALIVPSDPYILPGPVLGESTLQLTVVVVLPGGTNQQLTGVMDGLILDIANALRAANFIVTSVGAPFTDKETYGSPLFCAEIPLRIEITNKGE